MAGNTPRDRYLRGEPMFTPEDICHCGHKRKDHKWRTYPGACDECRDIKKCSHFAEPIRREP